MGTDAAKDLSRQLWIVRRSVAEMGGEFLRETGVLVLVFFGLAALLSGTERASLSSASLSFGLGLSLWVVGVWVERKRRP
jgi:hypothetical protein